MVGEIGIVKARVEQTNKKYVFLNLEDSDSKTTNQNSRWTTENKGRSRNSRDNRFRQRFAN